MDRCPNCHARDRGDSHCHRCAMELEQLRDIEQRAANWEQLAVRHLAAGNRSGARQALDAGLALQCRPLSAVLRGFIDQCPTAASATAEHRADVLLFDHNAADR